MAGRYIDWQNVVDRYKAVAGMDGEQETEANYLKPAEDEVDARLALRYPVPFAPVPGLVKDLCIDLTYYKAKLGSEHADKVWAYLEARFKGLLDGTITLTVSGTVLEIPDDTFNTHPYNSSFGPDCELNWSPDANWLIDANSNRGG